MVVDPISSSSDSPRAGDAYSVRQVAKLFEVPQRRLRYWSQTGFIKPSIQEGGRAYYSFRDLIAVKVAKALLDGGLPLRRVRRSLAALKTNLPDLDTSLANLRIRCEADEIIVDEQACSFEAATGQLVLDFSVETLREQAAEVLTLPWVGGSALGAEQPRTAYDWFLHGCELEEQWGGAPADIAGYEGARQAYETALALDPQLAAAWTNLGSMMAEMGDLDGAQEHYEQALLSDPDQPEAHCNLAELSLRQGQPEAAIVAYRQVLRRNPDWTEAHYGLARALLEVGGKGQALAHLERFCAAVDSDSEDEELQARRQCAAAVVDDLRAELKRS